MSSRASMATTAVLAVAVLVGACGATPASKTSPGAAAAESPPAGATGAAVPTVEPTRANAGATPLGDGPWIAYQASGLNGYGVQLLPLDGGRGRSGTNASLGGYQEHPDWSPDGRRFVFTLKHDDTSGELWIADGATGASERVVGCTTPCNWVDEPAWSPDGTMIAFQRATTHGGVLGSTIEIVDLATKAVRVVTRLPERFIGLAPRWSPDEQTLVIEEITVAAPTVDDAPTGGTVGLIEIADAEAVHPLLPMARRANNPDWSPDGRLILFSMPDKGGDPGGGGAICGRSARTARI